MSAALVRQALEFVDPDETVGKRKKRGVQPRSVGGQDFHPKIQVETGSKQKNSKKRSGVSEPNDNQKVISKLLKLSEPTLDKETANKIVKRAVTGKPVFDKIIVKKDEQKSILFPEDNKKKKSNKKKKGRL